MSVGNLIAWLPFDETPTQDLCGNKWTAYNSPTIEGKALQLNGTNQYLALNGSISLGGQDFTVSCWAYYKGKTGNGYNRLFEMKDSAGKLTGVDFPPNGQIRLLWQGTENWFSAGTLTNSLIHVELDYEHDKSLATLYVNGAAVGSKTLTMARTSTALFYIGEYTGGGSWYFSGSIDEFMIYDGVALHTENFTPPQIIRFDVQRKVRNPPLEWRYYNAGDADDLILSSTVLSVDETKSVTGTAFYQTTREKCFDLPTTNEVWIKFDVYFDGSNRWRAYNGGANGISGVCSYVNYSAADFGMWQNDNRVIDILGICIKNQLQTVLLHMICGATSGVIEAWVDGEKIYRYIGDVNHGEEFADIYLQSDGAGTFFSNVIISNREIAFGEGWQNFSFDTARRIKNFFEFVADVERMVTWQGKIQFVFDVKRKLVHNLELAADVRYEIIRPIEVSLDTKILVVKSVEFVADVKRALLAYIILLPIGILDKNTEGLQNFELTLAEQELTAQVSFTGVMTFEPLQEFKGHYLDYTCDMFIERSRQQGILFSYDCYSNIDDILYTQFNYSIDADYKRYKVNLRSKTITDYLGETDASEDIQEIKKAYASSHLREIANDLGLNLEILFDDFVSDIDIEQKNVTYEELIRSLFGWTSRLPHKQINIFVKGGTLYAIQRGKEQNIIDLTNVDYPLPIIEKELVRIFQGSSPDSTYTLNFVHPGWYICPPPPEQSPDGKTSYVYKNVSGYGDIENGYVLQSSTTRNDDGSRYVVVYNYEFVDNVYTCTSEIATSYDLEGEQTERKKTIHHSLSPSQQFSRVEDEEGITAASGVGSHLPGFYNKKITLFESTQESKEITLPGNPLIDTSFPLVDEGDFEDVANELSWLNRKIKETVHLTVYDFNHLIDFNDKILFCGREYHLVSNTATTTPRIINEQKLIFMRWY